MCFILEKHEGVIVCEYIESKCPKALKLRTPTESSS